MRQIDLVGVSSVGYAFVQDGGTVNRVRYTGGFAISAAGLFSGLAAPGTPVVTVINGTAQESCGRCVVARGTTTVILNGPILDAVSSGASHAVSASLPVTG